MAGLLTKNCDTIAQAVPGTSKQRLRGFLTNMQRDDEELNASGCRKRSPKPPWAMACWGWIIPVFPSKAKLRSGGPQYSGTLGKVGNCQLAVTCCHSDP
jgi:SRSO17 transposase